MEAVIKNYNSGGVDESVLCRTGPGGILSGGYLKDDPIEAYLGSQESPVFALKNRRYGVRYEHDGRDESTHHRPGDGYRAFAVATDSRLFFIIGDNKCGGADGDRSVSIPLANVGVVDHRGGVLAGELVVVTSTGMRWRFASRGDVEGFVDYLEVASTTWTRVETRLEDARKHLVDATRVLESRAYDDAMAAVRDAMAEADAARRRERRFCEDGVHAISARIERIEDRIREVRVRVLRRRAAHNVDAAEASWRADEYDAAYRAYSDAADDYQEALSVADPDDDDVDGLRDSLARVERNTSYLEQAPIDSAESAEHRARQADSTADRLRELERALECYRTALELDWGRDPQRFECDTETVRERIDDVAVSLVEARQSRAAEHAAAAADHYAADRYRDARARCREAREVLRNARDTARELVPDAVDGVSDRLDAVKELLAEVERRLDESTEDCSVRAGL